MQFILYVLYIIFFLLVFSVFLVTVCYYFKLFTTKYYLDKMPMLPQIPILGCVLRIKNTSDLYDSLMTYGKMYGRNYWAMVGVVPVLFTTDAKLLELILSSAEHIDKPGFYKVLHKIAGNGLVTTKGDNWRAQRKLMTPTFHFKILEQFMPIFNKHSNELVKSLEVETIRVSTDIHEPTKDWSLRQVTETVMGLKPNESSDSTTYTTYKEGGKELLQIAMERLMRPFEYIDYTYIFSRNYWKELKLVKTGNEIIKSIIQRRKKEHDNDILGQSRKVNEDGIKEKIVSLDLLIQYQRNGAQLTETNMEEQCQTLMYAGYDTTATTVAFTMYYFAKYPEVQEKVFEEVYQVLGDDINQEITTSHLQEMKYLDLVLRESLRLTPTIPLIARELHGDLEYGGMTLPKGLTVALAICGLHMDAEYFPEPEKFIPERFTLENCKKRPPYAYIPFSAGPRYCIGQKYGTLASKVALVKVLLNFKFFSVDHQLRLATEIVLMPKTGVKVAIRRRELAGISI